MNGHKVPGEWTHTQSYDQTNTPTNYVTTKRIPGILGSEGNAGSINLIFSHYGSPGSKKDVFLKEIRDINRVMRAVHSKFINATIAVAGDFNVRTSSCRYPTLIQEMAKSELSPFLMRKFTLGSLRKSKR